MATVSNDGNSVLAHHNICILMKIKVATLEGVNRVCNQFKQLIPNFDWMKQYKYNKK